MKPLHVLILALVVLAAGAAVWYNDKPTAPALAKSGQKLFPALAGSLDAVSKLGLRDSSDTAVNIEMKDGAWMLADKPKYYVDPSKVAELLIAASKAAHMESKTANPEFYSRLGLRDISDSESEAVLLSISSSGQTFDVLLGNSSDRFGGSTFVRKPDEQASYLVSPALNADTDSDAWLDKQIFNIATDEVQSVLITNDAGTVTEISKAAMFDSDFDLVGRGEGRVLNDTAVRGLARGLYGLRFEEVKRGAAFAFNDYERLTATYTLFSGIVVDVTLFYKDAVEDTSDPESGPPKEPLVWLNAGARFDETIAQQYVPQPGAGDENESIENRISLTAADIADRREQVEQINKTRKRWVYQITSARFDSMNRSDESLMVSAE